MLSLSGVVVSRSPARTSIITGSRPFHGSPPGVPSALFPALLFPAFWDAQAALMFLSVGFETNGRSIEEINRTLDTSAGVALDPVRAPAQ